MVRKASSRVHRTLSCSPPNSLAHKQKDSARFPGELKQALDKADAKYELKVFPGTHHGFCFPERAVYDTLAAEETWSKIFAMWDRNLK